jgi:hypothetical protein
MKITNTYNLPAPLFDAIARDEYRKSGRFSASELPSPPQMCVLKKRHDAEIVKDASDFLFLIQGKSIHKLLESRSGANDPDGPAAHEDLREKELVFDFGAVDEALGGVTVSGTTDLYNGDVVDWKVTSVWSFLLGGLKPEWEAQCNTYAWLWRRHGYETRALEIYAILRDWQKSKAGAGDNYPPIPFMRIPVPLWPDEQAEHFIRTRIAAHLLAEALADDALPPCSLEDQWARATSYALKKRGQVKAVRLFDSREAADASATPGTYVEVRPGKRTRCEEYCDARPFCHQFRAENPEVAATDKTGAPY